MLFRSMDMSVTTLTNDNFEQEVTMHQGTVLVDFWAGWCGPCKALSPVVDEIAREEKELKVAKVNIDEQPELARRFQVMSIPTLVVFKNGVLVNRSVGAIPKDAVLELAK